MLPHDVSLGGVSLAVWNAVLLVAVCAGYPALRAAFAVAGVAVPRLLVLRWLVTVYVSALGAQLFAYLFDLNTSALPPAGVSAWRYYLDPLYGAKTLYGAIVLLPLSLALVTAPFRDLAWRRALDLWTPPMFLVLGIVRLGCFLQGCCYGRRSELFGLTFPPGSAVYYDHLGHRLIEEGERSLAVVPTQLMAAAALLLLAGWSFAALRGAKAHVFARGLFAYSAFRFAVEFLRADPDRNFLFLFSTSQWIALAICLALSLRLRGERRGAA